MQQARTITGHLRLYALALALPIVLMSTLVGWAYLQQEASRIDRVAEAQVAAVASEIENKLEGLRSALTVLSVSPSVLSGDVEEIRRHLQGIKMPEDLWFVVRDPSGQQIMNTKLPTSASLPKFYSEGDDVIFDHGKTYYANLIWGPVGQTWITGIAIPVRSPPGGEDIKYSLSVIIPAAYFKQIFHRVPKGWIVAVNDRNGSIIARSQSHDERVGKPMSRTGWEVTKNVPPGSQGLWHNVYSLEGIRVQGAYLRMASTGWLVGVSALPEVYELPRRSILLVGAVAAAIALLSAALIAFVMGRRITEAINVLQSKAAAMRDMRNIDLPPTSLQEVNAVAGIMKETTHVLRRREEQQVTLIQELNHRVKNTLATVQSISRMTMRNSADLAAFDQAFSARLLALSATHNLLTVSAWSGVDLHELLTVELKPFQSARVLFSGPQVTLPSNVAIALGMVIHEMGTNAAKYGALRSDEGEVRVDWVLSQNVLEIRWRETGGAPVVPPVQTGFGSRLIEQTILRELQGTFERTFDSAGLRVVFKIPIGITSDAKEGEAA
ncbi:MAG TPA: sensor histidine kinase [Microvirga sp.]|jgi:two-component sensor histidine kinase